MENKKAHLTLEFPLMGQSPGFSSQWWVNDRYRSSSLLLCSCSSTYQFLPLRFPLPSVPGSKLPSPVFSFKALLFSVFCCLFLVSCGFWFSLLILWFLFWGMTYYSTLRVFRFLFFASTSTFSPECLLPRFPKLSSAFTPGNLKLNTVSL
jgi:hypothetical protein